MAGFITIRHKPRQSGEVCTDRTEWLVVEESPSFYICYAEGDGFGIKRKADYEIVRHFEAVQVSA